MLLSALNYQPDLLRLKNLVPDFLTVLELIVQAVAFFFMCPLLIIYSMCVSKSTAGQVIFT